jgi:hypothetical protein
VIFGPHSPTITGVAFSPDGRQVVSLSHGRGKPGSIRRWDAATGKELRAMEGAAECDGGVAFSPDGRILAAAYRRESARLWDAATGRLLRTLGTEPAYAPGPLAIAYSPDGRFVAVAGFFSGQVHLYEAATGGERWRFGPASRKGRSDARDVESHYGIIRSIAFTPDGQRLITGSDDTTALVWDVTGLLSTRPPSQPLPDAEMDRLCADLGGTDAAAAHRAVARLAHVPAQAIPRIKQLLPVVAPADMEKITAWVGKLGSDDFAEREQARANLARHIEQAEPLIRKALAQGPDLETARRLEGLLRGLAEAPERLHRLRALEVLERSAGHEARAVLQALAAGAPGAWLTEQAQVILKRRNLGSASR